MVADIGAWVALLAALLAIGVEVWRFSTSRAERATSHGRADGAHSQASAILRRVTPWSLIAVVALVMASIALEAYARTYITRAELLRRPISDLGSTSYTTDEEALVQASELLALSQVMTAASWVSGILATLIVLPMVFVYGAQLMRVARESFRMR